MNMALIGDFCFCYIEPEENHSFKNYYLPEIRIYYYLTFTKCKNQ